MWGAAPLLPFTHLVPRFYRFSWCLVFPEGWNCLGLSSFRKIIRKSKGLLYSISLHKQTLFWRFLIDQILVSCPLNNKDLVCSRITHDLLEGRALLKHLIYARSFWLNSFFGVIYIDWILKDSFAILSPSWLRLNLNELSSFPSKTGEGLFSSELMELAPENKWLCLSCF